MGLVLNLANKILETQMNHLLKYDKLSSALIENASVWITGGLAIYYGVLPVLKNLGSWF